MTATTGGSAPGEREIERNAGQFVWLWRCLIVVIGVFVLAHSGSDLDALNGYAGYGDFSIGLDDGGPDGFWKVTAVTPGDMAARLSLRPGDAIRPDRAIDFSRQMRAGEKLGFTLRRAGTLTHHVTTIAPRLTKAKDRSSAYATVFLSGVWGMIALVGLLVTIRGPARASTLWLGAALTCLGLSDNTPSLLESDSRLFPAFACLANAALNAPPVLLLAFARATRRETNGIAPRSWTFLLAAFAFAIAVFWGYAVWFTQTARSFVDGGAFGLLATAVIILGYLLVILLLGLSWRESRGQDRTRFAFMLAAIGLMATSTQVVGRVINFTGNDWSLTNPLVLLLVTGSIGGAAVFAYAVLRHRIIDLGFAINRTLVFGLFSGILLVAFGLIEWAVEHFLPRGVQEASPVIDAGVALLVFLTFHRVRDFVEGLVERLFFASWRQAEAALRRFVREAPFVTRSAPLTHAFAIALSRYAEGAPAAVYLRDEAGGAYRRIDGAVKGVGDALDPDDATLVSIRAEPKAIEIDPRESSLRAAVIAPMINRNQVIGVVLLGSKPSGSSYRPDEIDLIGWATRQVGLDLYALKIEALEAERASQAEQISVLNARLDGVLAGRVTTKL